MPALPALALGFTTGAFFFLRLDAREGGVVVNERRVDGHCERRAEVMTVWEDGDGRRESWLKKPGRERREAIVRIGYGLLR